MDAQIPPRGSFVRIEKPQLQRLIDRLGELGYRVVGPTVSQAAVVYDELESIDQLPIGYIDEQDGGRYRLEQTGENSYFDYVVGPHSLKNFLFPPRETLLEAQRIDGQWRMQAGAPPEKPLAVIGPRSCDLHALRVQDLVFLNEDYADPNYAARREGLFLAAVNCRRAAATCFCHSMETGPAVNLDCDLALTELEEHFIVEVGSDAGADALRTADWHPATTEEINQARELPEQLRSRMCARSGEGGAEQPDQARGRHMKTEGIYDLLMGNLEHARWDDAAGRCLACTNCTLVCPTCFCSTVEEVSDLTGENVQRERAWDSCFTLEHSHTAGGSLRKSIRSRYRQWLTHKLATWHDQYGTSGCIGCGRCITWCPVGIDLTEEVAAIRGEDA